jgi:hypothetical protein
MSGLLGVAATFLIGYGLVRFVRANRRRDKAGAGSRTGTG